MMKRMLKKILKNMIEFLTYYIPLFGKDRLFSYYIPQGPHRIKGYQEKEIDHLISYWQSKGFLIKDFKMQNTGSSHHSQGGAQGGVWIVFILRPTNFDYKNLLLSFDQLDFELWINHPHNSHNNHIDTLVSMNTETGRT
jgi:hypothetical protein